MKTLVSAAAVTALAGSAFGLGETLDRTNIPIFTLATPGVQITRTELGSHQPVARTSANTIYGWDTTATAGQISGSGFLASPPASGVLGAEDYGTTYGDGVNGGPPTGSSFELCEYDFVGGVTATSGVMFFDFFTNSFSYAGGFGVQFPSAGNFIWTITISNPAANVLPGEGYHQVFANDDPNVAPITSGQWFVSDKGANPDYGTNDLSWDSGSYDYGSGTVSLGYNFALRETPAPGAAAVMGLAGLAGLRRRRRA